MFPQDMPVSSLSYQASLSLACGALTDLVDYLFSAISRVVVFDLHCLEEPVASFPLAENTGWPIVSRCLTVPSGSTILYPSSTFFSRPPRAEPLRSAIRGRPGKHPTSALGHSRRFRHICVTSALPPLTTDVRTFQIGSFVPKRDIRASAFCAGCDTFHYLRAGGAETRSLQRAGRCNRRGEAPASTEPIAWQRGLLASVVATRLLKPNR